MAKVAKLFMNGGSQAVRLPAEFRFSGDEVYVRRDPLTGDVVLSSKLDSWVDFFALRDAVRAADLDCLVIYGDREHAANIHWATGFDPRFEEALLILPSEGRPVLAAGKVAYSSDQLANAPSPAVAKSLGLFHLSDEVEYM